MGKTILLILLLLFCPLLSIAAEPTKVAIVYSGTILNTIDNRFSDDITSKIVGEFPSHHFEFSVFYLQTETHMSKFSLEKTSIVVQNKIRDLKPDYLLLYGDSSLENIGIFLTDMPTKMLFFCVSKNTYKKYEKELTKIDAHGSVLDVNYNNLRTIFENPANRIYNLYFLTDGMSRANTDLITSIENEFHDFKRTRIQINNVSDLKKSLYKLQNEPKGAVIYLLDSIKNDKGNFASYKDINKLMKMNRRHYELSVLNLSVKFGLMSSLVCGDSLPNGNCRVTDMFFDLHEKMPKDNSVVFEEYSLILNTSRIRELGYSYILDDLSVYNDTIAD